MPHVRIGATRKIEVYLGVHTCMYACVHAWARKRCIFTITQHAFMQACIPTYTHRVAQYPLSLFTNFAYTAVWHCFICSIGFDLIRRILGVWIKPQAGPSPSTEKPQSSAEPSVRSPHQHSKNAVECNKGKLSPVTTTTTQNRPVPQSEHSTWWHSMATNSSQHIRNRRIVIDRSSNALSAQPHNHGEGNREMSVKGGADAHDTS